MKNNYFCNYYLIFHCYVVNERSVILNKLHMYSSQEKVIKLLFRYNLCTIFLWNHTIHSVTKNYMHPEKISHNYEICYANSACLDEKMFKF